MYERLESHGIKITAEEAEDLSGLRHMLKTLQTISSERENELKREGPNLKKDLEDGIAEFKVEVKSLKKTGTQMDRMFLASLRSVLCSSSSSSRHNSRI